MKKATGLFRSTKSTSTSKIITHLIVYALIALPACQGNTGIEQKPENNRSNNFRKYLMRNFKFTTVPKNHYYIILPTKGCASCNRKILNEITFYLNNTDVSLITSQKDLTKLFDNQISTPILFDTTQTAELDRLDLSFPNFTGLIHTDGKNVMTFIPFNETTISGVLAKNIRKSR